MIIEDFARVLYAPHKAFREIIKKPSYIGPLILLIIFIIAQTGAEYVFYQRYYYEQTMPTSDQGNIWAENSNYWNASSGTTIANDTSVYINATSYYSATSIQFNNSNTNDIWMQISDIGPVNCTSAGFGDVSLNVQIVTPSIALQNVTLTLLSGSSNFSRDLTSTFANVTNGMTNVWYNLTVPLNTTGWAAMVPQLGITLQA